MTDAFPSRIGRYELIERLGVGGMAEIFKARISSSHGFEKTLVLKCLLPELAQQPEYVDMFVTEARIVALLNHPNVVQVLDFGAANGRYFIAMEYVQGMDLKRVLALSVRRRRRPPTAVSVFIVCELLKALDYAHKKTDPNGNPLRIVHRDISPSNIFISHLAEVKLSDFGIAKATTRMEKSQVGEIKGKYGYVAPEMISGGIVDARADLFSAGVVLAELLIVRRLFLGRTDLDTVMMLRDVKLDRLHDYGQHIPADLMKIVTAALARDPATRYQNAASFHEALRRFLFENQLLVQDTDLKCFVESLEEELSPEELALEQQLVPQPIDALPAAVGNPRTAETHVPGPPRAVVRISAQPEDLTAQQNPVTGRLRADSKEIVGRKRKITLLPPPTPTPLSAAHLTQQNEKIQLSTDHALAAVRELESQRSLSTQRKMQLTQEATRSLKPDPVNLKEVAASRMTSTAGVEPDRTGKLEEVSLFKVIFELALAEETGLLAVRREDVVKEVFLVDGDPRHIGSNRTEELFGQFLVNQGVIDDHQLSLATAMLPYFKGRLGDSLVGLQILSAIQVARYLTQQVRKKLLDTFLWDRGEWAFYAGKQCQQESAPLGIDGFEVLGAAVQAMAFESVQERLAGYDGRKLRPADPLAVPPEVFRLGAVPRQVLSQLDGTIAVNELLDQVEATQSGRRERVVRALYLLTELGLLVE